MSSGLQLPLFAEGSLAWLQGRFRAAANSSRVRSAFEHLSRRIPLEVALGWNFPSLLGVALDGEWVLT